MSMPRDGTGFKHRQAEDHEGEEEGQHNFNGKSPEVRNSE
jgi:hypothetical protein